MKLPNKLTFLGKEPKMLVSSVMLWNWPCYSSDYDFFYRVIDSEGTHNFWVQNPIRDHDDMIMQISNNLKKWIRMEMLTNGHMLIEAKTKMSLTLGKHLSFVFGLSDAIPTAYATLRLESLQKHTFQYPRQDIPLFPNFVLLYCNAIKPSLMGDGFHKVLKVIPISNTKSEAYKRIEFEHEEFLPLATSEIQYIDFELRSHTGSFIEYVDRPETYITLSIKDN